MSDQEPLRYLEPHVVAQLATMELRARSVVEGFITGLHRSPYHGFSVEFTEHRPYQPGDEIRRIDWKAYGKTDRFYVKEYEEETNLKATVVLDASRSMAFASEGGLSKFAYASYLTAALSYLMVEQRDAVGLTLFDAAIRTAIPPRATRTNLTAILAALEHAEPASTTGAAETLHRVAEQLKRRGLVIVLSDLFDEPGAVLSAFKHFRHKGNEVIVMQVLDPLERSFAFGRDAVFRDMETGEEMMTQPWHIQQAYRDSLREFLGRYRKECGENGIDYVLLDTSTPYDRALTEYLHKRRRLH